MRRLLNFDPLPRDLPLSDAERKRLWSRSIMQAQARPDSAAEWAVVFVPAGMQVVTMAAFFALAPMVGLKWTLVALALLLPAQVALTGWLVLRFTRRARRRAITRAGFELCERCGFHLQGLSRPPQGPAVCPECGHPRISDASPAAPPARGVA